jgi:hypothetical protein
MLLISLVSAAVTIINHLVADYGDHNDTVTTAWSFTSSKFAAIIAHYQQAY